jgi:hypothetical protein
MSHMTISRNICGRRLRADRLSPGMPLLFVLVLAMILDPRYGHGVLRSPDPRFVALQKFCNSRSELSESPIIKLVKKVYKCTLH